ncbi:hypothetical protein D3C74_487870 [compost metagenome]
MPECQSGIVHTQNDKPDFVEARSEWIYTDKAIEQLKLNKPINKRFSKNAPRRWLVDGWIREKYEEEQLTLF